VGIGRAPGCNRAGDPGRRKISEKLRILIRRMAIENSGWGAPRIHGELRKPGFEISERTIARYLRHVRRRGDPARRWRAFLANHREAFDAMDFFAVPTLNFHILYCFFVISTAGAGLCISTSPAIPAGLGPATVT
jgi:hypothetical protein